MDDGLDFMLGGYTIRVTAGTDLSLLAAVLRVIRHFERRIRVPGGLYHDWLYRSPFWDRLATLVESKMGKTPCEPDTLYLFCGRRPDRIKGLV